MPSGLPGAVTDSDGNGWCLGRVVSRQELVNVGALSLNITGWPEMSGAAHDGLSAAGSVLVRTFQQLVPRVIGIPMSVDVSPSLQAPPCIAEL
jgi:hypothetical protein